MAVKYEDLSPDAKVWIYQADRKMTDMEKKTILEKSRNFIAGWASHGNPLKAKVDILYNTFLVLTVDEEDFAASGCSIDKSLHFIKQLETDHQINLLSRNMIAFLKNEEVLIEPLEAVKTQIKAGKIEKNSIIFNNLVNSRGQMETDWKIPLKGSWLKKYLPEI
jgi:hypothetical protein